MLGRRPLQKRSRVVVPHRLKGRCESAAETVCHGLDQPTASQLGFNAGDLSPKFPPAFGRVLGVKSLALGGHFVHVLSL